MNDFLTAMWQCRFLSLTTGCPMDMMHVLAEGTARVLLGCISWVMIRKWGVHEDKVVAAIKRYAAAHGHKRHRYPYINSSRVAKLKEGTEDGVCKPDCDARAHTHAHTRWESMLAVGPPKRPKRQREAAGPK